MAFNRIAAGFITAFGLSGPAMGAQNVTTLNSYSNIGWLNTHPGAHFDIDIRNSASPICWPAPEKTRESVAQALENSGFQRGSDAHDLKFIVVLHASSLPAQVSSDPCVVSTTYYLYVSTNQSYDAGGQILESVSSNAVFIKSSLFVRDSTQIQDEITGAFIEMTNMFAHESNAQLIKIFSEAAEAARMSGNEQAQRAWNHFLRQTQ